MQKYATILLTVFWDVVNANVDKLTSSVISVLLSLTHIGTTGT